LEERVEIELEENAQRKALTPAELSKQTLRKAVQVAPAISSVIEEKKPQGRKRKAGQHRLCWLISERPKNNRGGCNVSISLS
jgi:hypothetical protein